MPRMWRLASSLRTRGEEMEKDGTHSVRRFGDVCECVWGGTNDRFICKHQQQDRKRRGADFCFLMGAKIIL